ncbi:hypothetical protein C8R45DRAFT_1108309 [Mycena sanguinolenta]|nr:hypothetical protein C8R45DRAFT_1108309 [Mycena sanguinolenta]
MLPPRRARRTSWGPFLNSFLCQVFIFAPSSPHATSAASRTPSIQRDSELPAGVLGINPFRLKTPARDSCGNIAAAVQERRSGVETMDDVGCTAESRLTSFASTFVSTTSFSALVGTTSPPARGVTPPIMVSARCSAFFATQPCRVVLSAATATTQGTTMGASFDCMRVDFSGPLPVRLTRRCRSRRRRNCTRHPSPPGLVPLLPPCIGLRLHFRRLNITYDVVVFTSPQYCGPVQTQTTQTYEIGRLCLMACDDESVWLREMTLDVVPISEG